MREIPVDAVRFGAMIVTYIDVVPVLDQDKKAPTFGQQKTNADAVPAWEVQVLTKDPEGKGRPEVTPVKTWSHVPPALSVGDVLEFENLTGFVWSGENGGGVSLRCVGVKAAGPASKAKEKVSA